MYKVFLVPVEAQFWVQGYRVLGLRVEHLRLHVPIDR